MKHSNLGGNLYPIEVRIRPKLRPANWIISYPRSGNTFVRTLVANYFSGVERPLSLAEIVDSTMGEHDETLWTRLTGKQPSERGVIEEWNARPRYFENLRNMMDKTPPLIKSHTLLRSISGRPAFQFIPGDRIIYVVRHPCDVAVSASIFYNVDLDRAIENLLTADRYVIGHPNYGYEFTGSWSQHVRSWMADPGVPVHCIRYKDIVEDTARILTDIVRFLGFEPEPARVGLAVAFSGFDRLQTEEKETGFVEASTTSTQPFFREGRPGQWLDVLTINQARKILDADPQLIDHFRFRKLA